MPLWPGPGEQGMLLNEGQGVLDRGLLGSFDHRCHCRVGDCHNVDTDRQLLGVHQRTIMRVASRLDGLLWSSRDAPIEPN